MRKGEFSLLRQKVITEAAEFAEKRSGQRKREFSEESADDLTEEIREIVDEQFFQFRLSS